MEIQTERMTGIRMTKDHDVTQQVFVELNGKQIFYKMTLMSNAEMERFYEIDKPKSKIS